MTYITIPRPSDRNQRDFTMLGVMLLVDGLGAVFGGLIQGILQHRAYAEAGYNVLFDPHSTGWAAGGVPCLIVSRQSKGASDRRFKRGQLDAEGISDFAGGFSPETLRECTRGKPSGYG